MRQVESHCVRGERPGRRLAAQQGNVATTTDLDSSHGADGKLHVTCI